MPASLGSQGILKSLFSKPLGDPPGFFVDGHILKRSSSEVPLPYFYLLKDMFLVFCLAGFKGQPSLLEICFLFQGA